MEPQEIIELFEVLNKIEQHLEKLSICVDTRDSVSGSYPRIRAEEPSR